MDVLSQWRKRLRVKRCVLCHGQAGSDGLCAPCMEDMAAVRTDAAVSCPVCAGASAGAVVCGRCQQKTPPFERLWASVYYEPPVSSMLHAFKHLADSSMLAPLAALMLHHAPPWLEAGAVDMVAAMPLSKERRLFRGFNQSEGLAEAVGRRYGLPVLPHQAVFRRHHAPQSTLKREERRKNVRKAFEMKSDFVRNCNVLLIDDVITTGETLAELARALKGAGANRVFCWALARSQMKK